MHSTYPMGLARSTAQPLQSSFFLTSPLHLAETWCHNNTCPKILLNKTLITRLFSKSVHTILPKNTASHNYAAPGKFPVCAHGLAWSDPHSQQPSFQQGSQVLTSYILQMCIQLSTAPTPAQPGIPAVAGWEVTLVPRNMASG